MHAMSDAMYAMKSTLHAMSDTMYAMSTMHALSGTMHAMMSTKYAMSGIMYAIHRDHTLCRAFVLPKESPWLLDTILDGSPLRHRITARWHSFCRPQQDGRQSQPHLVLIQQQSGI